MDLLATRSYHSRAWAFTAPIEDRATMEPTIERRLAAVTAADIVGYSGQMEADEAGTLTRLRALLDEVVSPSVAAFDGRIFKTMGDGFLAEFKSALAAVEHARHLQAATAAHGASRLDPGGNARPLILRIGISLGDVMVAGDDLFGNAVNVAARMEGLAEPGGICVSAAVREHVRQAPGLSFADLGAQAVKGLVQPVHAYRLLGVATAAEPMRKAPRADDARPSIVVMPLRNLGGSGTDDYFADGMVEELITGLARIRWLTVIARNSAFIAQRQTSDGAAAAAALGVRYVVEGSVRRAADRIRIATQLLDADTGRTLWAERFDGGLEDVFELQDRIASGVVTAIEPTVRKAEIERAKRKRPDDLGAYDHYLRAVSYMYENTPEGRSAALEQVAAALVIDPAYAEAHGVAAWCYFARGLWEGGLRRENAEGARHHASAVRGSRTEDATTLAHEAIALGFATGEYPPALDMIDRAIAINPSSVHAHGHGCVINTWAGNYARSIELGHRALRLSPFDPFSVMAWAGMAGSRLMLGEHEAAIDAAAQALQLYPSHLPSLLITVAGLVRLGRLGEARQAAARCMALAPRYRIAQPLPIMEHFEADFREAGLPD